MSICCRLSFEGRLISCKPALSPSSDCLVFCGAQHGIRIHSTSLLLFFFSSERKRRQNFIHPSGPYLRDLTVKIHHPLLRAAWLKLFCLNAISLMLALAVRALDPKQSAFLWHKGSIISASHNQLKAAQGDHHCCHVHCSLSISGL